LALAAAGPSLEVRRHDARTVFLRDVSASVRGAGAERLEKLRASLPATERSTTMEFGTADETDIAGALRRAEAACSGAGRIVLLSDGRETRGSARAEAARLRARGFVVDAFATPEVDPLDARIVRIDLGGSEAREGEGVVIRVDLDATRP